MLRPNKSGFISCNLNLKPNEKRIKTAWINILLTMYDVTVLCSSSVFEAQWSLHTNRVIISISGRGDLRLFLQVRTFRPHWKKTHMRTLNCQNCINFINSLIRILILKQIIYLLQFLFTFLFNNMVLYCMNFLFLLILVELNNIRGWRRQANEWKQFFGFLGISGTND